MLYPPEFGSDPLFPRAEDFSVVQKDQYAGKGVMTWRSFRRGDIVARIARQEVPDIRQHTLQISRHRHNFDPYFSGYFLHSCDPNISVDMQTFTITALRDIAADSFLYMDYAETEDYLFKQFPCSCGATTCRGWITGRLELPYHSNGPHADPALLPAQVNGAAGI